MRKCIKCKSDQSSTWYRGPICRKCYMKRWSRDNKKKTAQYTYKWKNKNPEKERARHLKPKARFTSAKNSAITRGKEWNISLEEFILLIEKSCYYCNNQMGAGNNYGSGLDRIDNTIHYNINNVVPCCKICNSIRNNFLTMEETKIAIDAILSYRKIKKSEPISRVL